MNAPDPTAALPFDWQFPYASLRMPVLARNCVATSQPLAAQAGLRMLLAGGNAVAANMHLIKDPQVDARYARWGIKS